jgi:hypothetical protein
MLHDNYYTTMLSDLWYLGHMLAEGLYDIYYMSHVTPHKISNALPYHIVHTASIVLPCAHTIPSKCYMTHVIWS